MTEQAQREAFELAAIELGMDIRQRQLTTPSQQGKYVSSSTQAAYEIWQARGEYEVSQAKPAQPNKLKVVEQCVEAMVNSHPDDGLGYRYADWIQDENQGREHAKEWLAARRLEIHAILRVAGYAGDAPEGNDVDAADEGVFGSPASTQPDKAEVDIVQRLLDACNGHPHVKIPWPHRLLHDVVAEIKTLRAEPARIRERLEALKDRELIFESDYPALAARQQIHNAAIDKALAIVVSALPTHRDDSGLVEEMLRALKLVNVELSWLKRQKAFRDGGSIDQAWSAVKEAIGKHDTLSKEGTATINQMPGRAESEEG